MKLNGYGIAGLLLDFFCFNEAHKSLKDKTARFRESLSRTQVDVDLLALLDPAAPAPAKQNQSRRRCRKKEEEEEEEKEDEQDIGEAVFGRRRKTVGEGTKRAACTKSRSYKGCTRIRCVQNNNGHLQCEGGRKHCI